MLPSDLRHTSIVTYHALAMRGQGKLYHRTAVYCGYHKRQTFTREAGSQMVEFVAAIMLLVFFVLIPCLDLAVVPIRWMMAQQLIDSYVRTLAMCETFTESLHTLESDPSLSTRLVRLGGVQVESLNLTLKITRVSPNKAEMRLFELHKPGEIPAAWLPNGAFAPCTYALNIEAELSIAPAVLIKLGKMNIPGLTEPIPVTMGASHEWTNLGRDPNTEKYWMNE
jgi:hypothetical protein